MSGRTNRYLSFLNSPPEECGVFGMYKNNEDINIVRETYKALFALQHRGQESAGIAINNGGEMKVSKDIGMVSEVFNKEKLDALGDGEISVGHVCYAPMDMLERANAQPMVLSYIKGSLAIANNGAITNLSRLRKELEMGGAIFQSNSNAELFAYVIASQRLTTTSIEEAVLNAAKLVRGAYSLIVASPSKLIAVRDKNGFRPLCIGKLKDSWIFTSESCVLEALGGEFIRDVEPGEVVVADDKGLHSYKSRESKKTSLCIFEYVYLARPDSVVDGVSVHMARQRAGIYLAKENPVEADLVCGVPDSGISAALGYAAESKIPYGTALIKNKYIARAVTRGFNAERDQLLGKTKLSVLGATVKGKRLVIIDDSIVRGNTASHIVKLLREAGASEVHMRISSPPFKYPCYYGADINEDNGLIASDKSVEEIRKYIGADSLAYLSVDSLSNIAMEAKIGICNACYTGNYPADIPSKLHEDKFAKKIQE